MAWQQPPPRPPGGGPGPGPGPGGGSGPESELVGGPQPGPAPAQAAQNQNLYQLLQVDAQAHPTIIRYAYRFLAGMYHPDNAESGNTDLFRVVTDAFRTLSDPGRRNAYDAQVGIKAPPPQQPGAAGVHGLGSIPIIPKTGISYNEVELRLAVLQILLTARK